MLKLTYDSQDDIPEAHRDLYTEQEGKWVLTGIEGVKTVDDVKKLQSALEKERSEHKKTKDKLAIWADLEHDDVLANADRVKELETELAEAKSGHTDDDAKIQEKVDKLVEAKVATIRAPLDRELAKLTKTNAEQAETITDFETKDTMRTITDAVRTAATGSKVIDTAMDDVVMLAERVFEVTEEGNVITRDGIGATPGIAPDIWLGEMQERRPHWWPASQGGGASGGAGGNAFTDNPWAPKTWNLTKQGQALRSDPDKAQRMAKAAGSRVGATAPTQPAQ